MDKDARIHELEWTLRKIIKERNKLLIEKNTYFYTECPKCGTKVLKGDKNG